MEEPQDMPYGDRRAMVRDPWGSMGQIADVGAVHGVGRYEDRTPGKPRASWLAPLAPSGAMKLTSLKAQAHNSRRHTLTVYSPRATRARLFTFAPWLLQLQRLP